MGKAFLKNNALILAVYALLAGTALFFIFNYSKVSIHIYLNQFVGNLYLNQFFYYITYLGDGLVAPFMLLIILLYNVRLGIYAVVSFLAGTLFSQLLKHAFFDDVNRPFYVFQWEHPYQLTYVDGVEKFIHNSFPSGHATQAFSIFMCLVFATRNVFVKWLWFALAVGTAISRVYLSQHWLVDITVGSLIGTFFSLLFYFIFIAQNKFAGLNKPISAFKKP